MKNKEFAKAVEFLSLALEKEPENLGTLNSLGTCYMALNNTEEAIKTYKKVIELHPENAMAYFNIGSAYQIQKNHELACEYLRKATDIEEDIEIIRAGEYISKIDKYFNSFYSKKTNILEYLDKFVIVFDELGKINQRIDNIKIENKNLINTLIDKNKSVPDVINNLMEFDKCVSEKADIFFYIDDMISNKITNTICGFNYRDILFYKNEIEGLCNTLTEAIKHKKKILILGGNEESAKKISILLKDRNLENSFTKKVEDLPNGKIIITTGSLSSGFEAYDLNLLVVASEDFFTSTPVKKKKVTKKKCANVPLDRIRL